MSAARDATNSAIAHRIQQDQSSDDVVVIILRRIFDRLTNQRRRRHVNDRIGALLFQRLAKLVCLEQVAFNKIGAVNNGAAMSFGKIVVDHNFVAVFYQFFCDDTSDVPCAARYKYPHAFPLKSFRQD